MIRIDKHIVLIGFMGSGKSTVGDILASHLSLVFVDMDAEIERTEGKSITEIFNCQGEAYFRNLEKATLNRLLKSKIPTVIATGGGTPCFGDNIDSINNGSYSFYLKVGRSSLVERLLRSTDRPLINGMNKKELNAFIRSKLADREHYYKQASKTVMGIYHPKSVAKGIIQHIKSIK